MPLSKDAKISVGRHYPITLTTFLTLASAVLAILALIVSSILAASSTETGRIVVKQGTPGPDGVPSKFEVNLYTPVNANDTPLIFTSSESFITVVGVCLMTSDGIIGNLTRSINGDARFFAFSDQDGGMVVEMKIDNTQISVSSLSDAILSTSRISFLGISPIQPKTS